MSLREKIYNSMPGGWRECLDSWVAGELRAYPGGQEVRNQAEERRLRDSVEAAVSTAVQSLLRQEASEDTVVVLDEKPEPVKEEPKPAKKPAKKRSSRRRKAKPKEERPADEDEGFSLGGSDS